jgi:flagellar biosynthesis protein
MAKSTYFQAFALGLPRGVDTPPVLAARGEFSLADFIVACARKHGVPIVERPEICGALAGLEVGQEIPMELFEVAAAILAEVGGLVDTIG